jgi:hypothetical protein
VERNLKLIRDLEQGIKPTLNASKKYRTPTPRKPKAHTCKKFKANPNKFFSKPLMDIELKCLDLDEEMLCDSVEEDKSPKSSRRCKKNLTQLIGDVRIDTEARLCTLESESKKILATNESNLISEISPKKNLSF